MQEIWKDIPGYENLYEASNLGNIRTKEGKKTYTKLHGERVWKSRLLKFKKRNVTSGNKKYFAGYAVSLWKDGKCKDYLVHRLIASAFLENHLYDNMTVNHIDEDRTNNNIENLEWLTRADNIRYSFQTGRYPQARHDKVYMLEGV